MQPAQREALDGALSSMRVGRMTRRTFLQRAIALGLSASAAGALLDACGGARGTTFVVWQSEIDPSGTYRQLVDSFNSSNRDNIHVTYLDGFPETGQLYNKYTYMLDAHSGSTDILSLDATWPAQFAAKRWLLALEAQWPESERAAFLPGPLTTSTFGGHVWAAPYRIDAGLLYYRTDLVPQPPASWAEMAAAAARFQANTAHVAGFVWPGAIGEGLTCVFVELLHAYGGAVIDPANPYRATLDSTEALAALNTMVGWMGTASPVAVTTYTDDDARSVWQRRGAVFMRNWASAYPQRDDPSATPVAGVIGVRPTPAALPSGSGHSCLGGWQFGVNAFSRAPGACWTFIRYMLEAETQRQAALGGGLMMTLASLYRDPQVLARYPFFAQVAAAFGTALPRPISPGYSAITQTLQAFLHQALVGKITPTAALAALQPTVQAICTRTTPLPPDGTPVPTLH